MNIRLERATPADAGALTATQVRAFEGDASRHPGMPHGGPPGYDDVAWQLDRMMDAQYFKILDGEELLGGAIVFQTGPARSELGRIWVAPDHQGRGVGGRALELLERAFPSTISWTLDTPAWATHNQRFYERRGYRKVREARAGSILLFFYEKRLDPGAVRGLRRAPDST